MMREGASPGSPLLALVDEMPPDVLAEEARTERSLRRTWRLARSGNVDLTDAGQTAPEALDPAERAQELVYQAWEEGPYDAGREKMKRALQVDPSNVDALAFQAILLDLTPSAAVAGLEAAVAVGADALGEAFFEELRGRFWGRVETRPYMRAKLHLALRLRWCSKPDEALRHLEALLDLNPADDQGARFQVLFLALETDDRELALRILDRYPDDTAAHWVWARVLVHQLAVRQDDAVTALDAARAANPYVEVDLLDPEIRSGDCPDRYAPGSVQEAEAAVFELAQTWDAHPGALEWLAAHARAHRIEQRRTAIRRFEEHFDQGRPSWLEALFDAGGSPSEDLVSEVCDAGRAAVPWLLALVHDRELHDRTSAGEGCVPADAASLLGELELPETAPPLAERLIELEEEGEGNASTAEAIGDALAALGRPGVEAVLDLLDRRPDVALAPESYVHELLAFAGWKDERIYRRFVDLLDVAPSHGAHNLAQYEDDRALGPLHEALARTPVRVEGMHPPGNQDVLELADAIRTLGGALTAQEEAQRREVLRLRHPTHVRGAESDADPEEEAAWPASHDEPPPPVEPLARRDRPGRNDPCWCGSGKKYKRCHLGSDEED